MSENTRTRKLSITQTSTSEAIKLDIALVDGQNVSIELSLEELSPAVVIQLATRGLIARIHDKTAPIKDFNEVVKAINDLVDQVCKGELGTKPQRGIVTLPATVEAIMLLQGKDLEDSAQRAEALATWKAKSEEEKATLRLRDDVKAMLVQLRASKVSVESAEPLNF